MIELRFEKGEAKPYPKGVLAEEVVDDRTADAPKYREQVVGCLADGQVVDLLSPINKSADIKFITIRDEAGQKMLRHSTAHVMAYALKALFPEIQFAIGPAIKDGFYYDFDGAKVRESDFDSIEKKMRQFIDQQLAFTRKIVSRLEAKKLFAGDFYKQQLIADLPESEVLTLYQVGDFVDLCRGPHIPNTAYIGAFKLLRLAGAYWRGDSKNAMLTRLYGTSFSTEKDLQKYLNKLQEAKAADHAKLGKDLGLFFTDPLVGQGLPLLTPKGTTLKNLLIDFIEAEERKRGYQFTATPFLAKSDLYKISGHWDHYKDDMFVLNDDSMALRPMTCPFHFSIYNATIRSYKDLPIRYAETSVLFRNEASGEMHGLSRVRQFTLADGHIMCRSDQLEAEFMGCLELIQHITKTLRMGNYSYRFSKWDPTNKSKYIDNPEAWERTQSMMKTILDRSQLDYVEADDEAAFYGPKLDVQMENVYGKEDTIMTVQIDFALPERFGMKYIDEHGKESRPVVIHRSSIGCYERTIAQLIEQHKGKFPFWLAPEQAIVLPVGTSEKIVGYATSLVDAFLAAGLRVAKDFREETLAKKIRDAQASKIPCMVVVGEKELRSDTISLRSHRGETKQNLKATNFIQGARQAVLNKQNLPFFEST